MSQGMASPQMFSQMLQNFRDAKICRQKCSDVARRARTPPDPTWGQRSDVADVGRTTCPFLRVIYTQQRRQSERCRGRIQTGGIGFIAHLFTVLYCTHSGVLVLVGAVWRKWTKSGPRVAEGQESAQNWYGQEIMTLTSKTSIMITTMV